MVPVLFILTAKYGRYLRERLLKCEVEKSARLFLAENRENGRGRKIGEVCDASGCLTSTTPARLVPRRDRTNIWSINQHLNGLALNKHTNKTGLSILDPTQKFISSRIDLGEIGSWRETLGALFRTSDAFASFRSERRKKVTERNRKVWIPG